MPVVPGGPHPPPGGVPPGTPTGEPKTNDYNAIQYIGAWGLVLLLLMLLNRSRWGHALIYYALALSLLILLVGNYTAITGLLAPASQSANGTPDNIPASPDLDAGVPPINQAIGPTAPITARAPAIPTEWG